MSDFYFFMKFTFKHLSFKNLCLGLVTILLGTFIKFTIIPILLSLFNIELHDTIQHIIGNFVVLIVNLGIYDLLMSYFFFMDGNTPPHFPYDHSNHSENSENSGNENPSPKKKIKGRVLIQVYLAILPTL